MSILYTYGAPRSALVYDAGTGKHRPASHPVLGGDGARHARREERIGPFAAHILVAARHAHGWTQDELADMVGVTRTTLAAWEHGMTPSPPRLAALERLLGSLRA